MPPKSNKTTKTAIVKKSSTKKRRNSQKKKTFNTYIVKVLKKVHPDAGIGEKEGVPMINGMLEYVVKKVAFAVSILLRRTGRNTVTSREIQSAIRLTFPGELAKHAVSAGTKAVTYYNATQATGGPNPPPRVEGKQSKANRSGLTISVSRTSKIFYPYVQGSGIRKGVGAAIYLAAALEYITSEILELAGNVSRDNKVTRIKPRHINLSVSNDEELNKMFQNTVMQGGVIPNIHTVLLPNK